MTIPELPPLMVGADDAARLCSVSKPTWDRLHAVQKVPAPRKLNRRVLWSVDELRSWIAAGCPSRSEWDRMKADAREMREAPASR